MNLYIRTVLYISIGLGITACKPQLTNNPKPIIPTSNNLSIPCNVTHIQDGDTLSVKCSNGNNIKEVKVRLACIDAPESTQQSGDTATNYLTNIINQGGNNVTLHPLSTDKYGRMIAEVYIGNTLIQESLLASGSVRIYEYFSNCPSIHTMKESQIYAQKHKLGIWNYNSIAPWVYRQQH